MSQSNLSGAPRKSRGRQRVSMKKMENQSNLQVTFSKRRAGLFKKASELCTLCGAEAAIVVFSPAEKAYCFGHPNAKTVLDRLSAGAAGAPAPDDPRSRLIIEAHRNSTIRELNMELTQVEGLLRAEKSRAEEIEMVRKAGRMQQWFPTSFDGLGCAQLCGLKESVMRFKKSLEVKVQKDMVSGNQFPAFGDVPKLTLGSREFPCYPNAGLFGVNMSSGHTSNGDGYYVNSGINGSSSSTKFNDVGNVGFGLNIGRHPRLF